VRGLAVDKIRPELCNNVGHPNSAQFLENAGRSANRAKQMAKPRKAAQ
jgi:hypothetical protein